MEKETEFEPFTGDNRRCDEKTCLCGKCRSDGNRWHKAGERERKEAESEFPAFKLFTLDDGQTVLRATVCETAEKRERLLKEGYTAIDTLWVSRR